MQQLRNSVVRFAASFGLFTGLCGLALTGCSKTGDSTSASKPGTVAVVDLDEVCKSVGWLSEITDDKNAADQDLKSQLQAYATSVQNAFSERRKAIGVAAHLNAADTATLGGDKINNDDFQKLPLTREQKDDFIKSNSEASQAVNQAVQQAQQLMQQHQARVIESYREAMKPSVRRVAANAGVTTVLPPNTVFWFDPVVDLSNQVVDDLRKAMPQHTMPVMPKMNLAEFKFTTAIPASVTAPAVAPITPHATEPSH